MEVKVSDRESTFTSGVADKPDPLAAELDVLIREVLRWRSKKRVVPTLRDTLTVLRRLGYRKLTGDELREYDRRTADLDRQAEADGRVRQAAR
jgi:hypothetical protein